MNRYRIRFNRTHGQPGRGSVDHVWRVFENDQEYIVKNIRMNVSSYGEKEDENWNIVCYGFKTIDHETSTITINAT
jgi:hypothetical protein